jgi:hypothetical protein
VDIAADLDFVGGAVRQADRLLSEPKAGHLIVIKRYTLGRAPWTAMELTVGNEEHDFRDQSRG